jgi:hypothetical protein
VILHGRIEDNKRKLCVSSQITCILEIFTPSKCPLGISLTMFNNAYIQSNTGYVQSINQSIICSYKADNSYNKTKKMLFIHEDCGCPGYILVKI